MRLNKHFVGIVVLAAANIFPFLPARPGWRDNEPVRVNNGANPGKVNPHHNSGGRRMVRIGETIVILCAHQNGERTYRSNDDGCTWSEIDAHSGFSGCLLAGPNSTVYHFFISGIQLLVVKFACQDTPAEPRAIYQSISLSETSTGPYRAVNATIDAEGHLYAAAHWGAPDQIYLFSSYDQGDTWDGPRQITSGEGPWYYPHLEVAPDGKLLCVYDTFKVPHKLSFAWSIDGGLSWSRRVVSEELTYNPSLLPVSDLRFYLFAQSGESNHRGLVVNMSNDAGRSWNGWHLIDKTCGYADPSPGLGADGRTVFVAYRSSNGTGVTSGSCGDKSRARIAMSADFGSKWSFVDDHYNAERTGTRFQIRYQTFWNYGGPLEWIWMQYEDNGSQHYTYYDVNKEVEIYQHQTGTPLHSF